MIVKVTQEDIDFGYRKSVCKCPVALALRRLFPGSVPLVGGSFFVYKPENKISLPAKAVNFIKKFDKGLPVQPFEFEFNP